MKIGFFDSGLGGLTILKAVRAQMPEYAYVFFGDTLHVPYGDRDEEEIAYLTWCGIERLFEADALLVIVACNSASAESLRKIQDTNLREKYPDRKVLGVIIPTIETLMDVHAHTTLLIGTTRTVTSHKYKRELEKRGTSIKLIEYATPSLVPKIESGDLHGACADAQRAIDPHAGEIDTLILGCTHYTLIKPNLQKKYPKLNILAQDEIIPNKLESYLAQHSEIETKLDRSGGVEIILSAETPEYEQIKKDFLVV